MSAARRWLLAAALGAGLPLLLQCTSGGTSDGAASGGATASATAASARPAGGAPDRAAPAAPAGWDLVYSVLQHPRCANCHPAGDRPLVGARGDLHPQNVQRGPAGEGAFGMRCDTCHHDANTPGRHMPPGAPHWQLPHPDAPLVFTGRSSGELCRQLKDPAQNGGKTPEQLLEHMASDPLVLWGWEPGDGRVPVGVPHDAFVEAVRAWVEGGCGCPD